MAIDPALIAAAGSALGSALAPAPTSQVAQTGGAKGIFFGSAADGAAVEAIRQSNAAQQIKVSGNSGNDLTTILLVIGGAYLAAKVL